MFHSSLLEFLLNEKCNVHHTVLLVCIVGAVEHGFTKKCLKIINLNSFIDSKTGPSQQNQDLHTYILYRVKI